MPDSRPSLFLTISMGFNLFMFTPHDNSVNAFFVLAAINTIAAASRPSSLGDVGECVGHTL
jgi:hypothetical protein